MPGRPLAETIPAAPPRRFSADMHVRAVMDDLRFLAAWEEGRVPLLGAILRVRQIRRAMPDLAAALQPTMVGDDARAPRRRTPRPRV